MLRQADGDGKSRRAAIGCGQFLPPTRQFLLGMAAGRRFIDGVVHLLAEGVDGVHGVAPGLREKQKE